MFRRLRCKYQNSTCILCLPRFLSCPSRFSVISFFEIQFTRCLFFLLFILKVTRQTAPRRLIRFITRKKRKNKRKLTGGGRGPRPGDEEEPKGHHHDRRRRFHDDALLIVDVMEMPFEPLLFWRSRSERVFFFFFCLFDRIITFNFPFASDKCLFKFLQRKSARWKWVYLFLRNPQSLLQSRAF